MLPELQLFHWGLLCGGLLVAAGWDVRQRRVPNWLSVTLSITGLAARFLQQGFVAGAWGVAGVVVGLMLLIVPFAKRWIGAGDVKLLGAAGAWLGPLLIIYAGALVAIFGMFIGLWYWWRSPAELRREIRTNLLFVWLARSVPQIDQRRVEHAPPYALAVAAGVMATVALQLGGLWARFGLLPLMR